MSIEIGPIWAGIRASLWLLTQIRHPIINRRIIEDCKSLGITQLTRRANIGQRMRIEPFVTQAKLNIKIAGYAPLSLIEVNSILIEKANNRIPVTVVLPDPGNQALMEQISNFGAGPGEFYTSLKSVFTTCRNCWTQVGTKEYFKVWTSSLVFPFTITLIDEKIASAQYTAQGWGITDRLLVEVSGNHSPLLRQYLRWFNVLMTPERGAEELNTLELFNSKINDVPNAS